MNSRTRTGMAFLLAALLYLPLISSAQPSAVKRGIEKSMEQKYGDPQRKKGKEEIAKVTYENDKRYKDPNNKVQATIAFESKQFNKKGDVKTTTKDKIVFGKTGECMVMREGEKDEMWMVFNYADKANYMVMVRDGSAMKMPLINMQKMIEKGAQKEAERSRSDDKASWKATEERQTINGYNCRKFIYTYPDNPHFATMDAWVSTEVKLDLSGNYMLGARLSSYKFPDHPEYKDMINGFMVRSILYDKKGKPEMQRDLVELKPSADEKYFDLSPFKINDVLSGL
ncbi:DUF4412 domain-containing protein [Taibaiella koreensis]|uniref:DUF4412 domain-containing protein n=1 Tax=Taibaiella koreensis TaxID=1268548 RepID=UPI000E59B913|nr:DUF4412 domain-containing protein [Taibaiella koreensis]